MSAGIHSMHALACQCICLCMHSTNACICPDSRRGKCPDSRQSRSPAASGHRCRACASPPVRQLSSFLGPGPGRQSRRRRPPSCPPARYCFCRRQPSGHPPAARPGSGSPRVRVSPAESLSLSDSSRTRRRDCQPASLGESHGGHPSHDDSDVSPARREHHRGTVQRPPRDRHQQIGLLL